MCVGFKPKIFPSLLLMGLDSAQETPTALCHANGQEHTPGYLDVKGTSHLSPPKCFYYNGQMRLNIYIYIYIYIERERERERERDV